MATIGGGYAALMGGKKNAQPKKQNSSAPSKPKTAKVLSLKDTKEKHPAPTKQVKDQAKNTQPKVTKEKEPEKDLTKREAKDLRNATDRHVPRSGHAPGTGPKVDKVQEELDAQKPIDEEKRKEIEEREAERKKKEAEEERQVTYADYQKSVQQKKAEVALKTSERKVDSKGFSKMTEVKKEDDFGFMKMKISKEEKQGKQTNVVKSNKTKFVKSENVQLGFNFNKQGQRSGYRGDRRGPRPEQKPKEETPAPAPAAETEVAEAPAVEATTTESAE